MTTYNETIEDALSIADAIPDFFLFGTQRPLNKWFIKQGTVLEEGAKAINSMLEEFGGRNFPLPPGVLAEGLFATSMGIKRELTKADMEFVQGEANIDLEQLQFGYQLAMQVARLALEVSKADLGNAFQLEGAVLARQFARDEEMLTRTALEIERRKILLSEAKLDMGIEMVELQKEMAKIDRNSFDSQRLLMQAKLETLQTKLGMLPYLEKIVDAEKELVQILALNAGKEQEQIAKNEELIAAKQALLPFLYDKAEHTRDLAEAQEAYIGVETERAILSVARVELEGDKLDAEMVLENQELILEQRKRSLAILKNQLETLKMTHNIDLTNYRSWIDLTNAQLKRDIETAIRNVKSEIENVQRNTKSGVRAIELRTEKKVNETKVDGDVSVLNDVELWRNRSRLQTAAIDSQARVTANLIHLIGSR